MPAGMTSGDFRLNGDCSSRSWFVASSAVVNTPLPGAARIAASSCCRRGSAATASVEGSDAGDYNQGRAHIGPRPQSQKKILKNHDFYLSHLVEWSKPRVQTRDPRGPNVVDDMAGSVHQAIPAARLWRRWAET